MATCSPATLMADGKAFGMLSRNQMDIVELQLLCEISDAAGGGGGGGGGTVGVVDPEGSVTANAGALYWNSNNQTFWVKQSGTGNTGWVQLI